MRRHAPWLLLVFLLPLSTNPTASSVWDSNEAFYTQTPREMLQRGDWLVPHFNDRPRLNKPPLAYWTVAILYRVFGVSLACERWLLAALGMGCVLLTYGIALRLRDSATALLAAGIFATNFRFLVLSRRLLIDILLLTCLLAALLCYLIWRDRRDRRWLWLSAFLLGLGFLAKGPVVSIALAVGVVFTLWRERSEHDELPWKSALLIFAVVSASWYVALGWHEGWRSVVDFFWRENLGRFSHLDYGPQRGPFYYVGVILADFFPWSLLFAAAIVWKIRHWKRLPAEQRSTELLLLLWLAFWFVIFSFSRNKQEYYILPLYPLAAVWVADFALRVDSSRILGALGGVVTAVLGVGLALMAGDLFGSSWLWWLPVAPAGAFAWLAWRRRWRRAAASLSLMYALLFLLFLPRLESYRPVASMAETLAPRVHHQAAQAGYLNLAAPSLRFYLNEPILELFEISEAAALLDSGRPLYLIVTAGDWPELQEATRIRLRLVERRPRLVVTLRTLLQVLLHGGGGDHPGWVQPVLLITNS